MQAGYRVFPGRSKGRRDLIRLYVESPLTAGAGVIPTPDQARYLTGVMRKGVGDGLLLFNGRDGDWRATIADASKRGWRRELA
jgi:16S rRNA (uracil1498-N3)-methyltransferase